MAKLKLKNSQPDTTSFIKREVLALLFFGLGVFFYLSLFSYSPADPSFNSLSTSSFIHNWGGIVGSYLADSLLFLFGGGAYFIGLVFVFLAILFFTQIKHKVHIYDVPVYLMFLAFVSVFFQLQVHQLEFREYTMDAGGLVGGLFSKASVAFLGEVGTYLVVVLGSLFTIIWATGISAKRMGVFFGNGVKKLAFWIRQKMVLVFNLCWQGLQFIFKTGKKLLAGKTGQPRTLEVKINRAITPLALPTHKTLPIPTEAPLPVSSQLGPELSAMGPKILERIDKNRKQKQADQLEFQNIGKGYQLPSLSLLDSSNHGDVNLDVDSLKMNARLLEKKLMDFNVDGHVTEIHPGPVITMYEFKPAPGVKLSRIANLVDDLSLAMGGRSVRIVAPLPNKPAVGIEIPNNIRETVVLKDIIADEKFDRMDSRLPLALGKDIEGIPFIADLAKTPHLLVAGATGAGKSVSINAMILSILYKSTPDEVRMILVDPKMLELSIYEGIAHLLLPVVTNPKKAALALQWAVREMERRYKLMADINARSILNYNRMVEKKEFTSKQAAAGIGADEDVLDHNHKLPYIVIIIDELADLMMVSSRDVEECITRLAQMARAAGIHLILATQRPSVDVLTGVIKANFPSRISFKVTSKHDARTILDTIGSERLLGSGDMLFIPPALSKMIRIHGAFVSDAEVARVVESLKKQAKPVYDESILTPQQSDVGELGQDEEADDLYDQAVAIVADTKQASISMIQRRLRVGYNRAARMIEKMEVDGIVSPPSTAGHRQVLVSSFEANP